MSEYEVGTAGNAPRRRGHRILSRSLATVAALATVGGLLVACGSSSTGSSDGTSSSAPSADASAAGAGTPVRGGTLRIGASGGGPSDTLDPHNNLLTIDTARAYMLFDQLVKTSDTGESEFVLADSITPNADGTEWTIKIKPNVHFHDGTTLKADDILWNFTRILDNKFPGTAALGPIDIGASKVVDDTTLTLKFTEPYATLIDNLALYSFGVIPQTWNADKPVGTGAFKFESFTPGTGSTFVRNDDYWNPELPYLDKIIVTDVADETAQVNGLQSGEFDAINNLSAASATVLEGSGFQVVKSKTGGFVPFLMRVDIAPFNDPKVREAFKLIVNRQEMLDAVFSGFGQIGNDIPSPFDPSYDQSIPQRTQDIAKAKTLLKEAGKENMSIDLYTSDGAGPGAVAMAQVFATQAKDAGVTVTVKEQQATDFFENSYKKVPLAMEYWQYLPYANMASQAFLPTSPWNATLRNDPAYNALYTELIKTVDPAKQKEIIQKMMKIDYEGGMIIPFFLPVIDAWAPIVKGVHESVTGLSPGGFDWAHIWMQQ